MNVDFALVVIADGTERRVPASAAPDAPYTIGRGADAKLFLNHATVSRAHARMVYDAARGGYRLLDEGSTRGTQVIRRGELIKVPKNDPRGVLLMSGDEIQLGDVVLRLTIE